MTVHTISYAGLNSTHNNIIHVAEIGSLSLARYNDNSPFQLHVLPTCPAYMYMLWQ